MQDLIRIVLENEMDLILVHKRSMKLAELTGLSLSAQTSFATAVSEISRCAIEDGKKGSLTLGTETEQRTNFIVASLKGKATDEKAYQEGIEYARRLVSKYKVNIKHGEIHIALYFTVSSALVIDINKIDYWRNLFRNEPAVSPYDEIKRKNDQLNELSEKVMKSEARYRTLTNALPMIIFSISADGEILYANEWLGKFTGETIASLNDSKWGNVVHPEDYGSFPVSHAAIGEGNAAITVQTRLRNKNNSDYYWHQVSLTPFRNDNNELIYWIGYIVDIHAQKVFEETLRDNEELKKTQERLEQSQHTLEQYIEELNRSNHELQQFAFVASHDLQEPVRKILYYSDYLLNRYGEAIDVKGLDHIKSMQAASQRMRSLIQDLLSFSQINRAEIVFKDVDLNKVAAEAVQDMEMAIEEKQAIFHIQQLPHVQGDERMLRQLFENIISNALKYSNPEVIPEIKISYKEKDGFFDFAFKDNGIGFDEKYLPQMFTLFQRLHTRQKYEGTGLGLAICRKIVDMHHGKMWAEGKEGKGATFYFSLPVPSSAK